MDNFYISTWNAHGKGSPEEIDKILTRAADLKSEKQYPHLVCIQQTNLPPSDTEFVNYKWLCSGKFGSAVLVNKASSLVVESFDQVCEEICVAKVKTDVGTIVKVVSCYIPPSTEYVSKDLWAKLVEIFKTDLSNGNYILAGDFNAEIGKDDCTTGVDRGAIGSKLYHKASNENGKLLIKLVINAHAIVASTIGANDSDLPSYTYKNGQEKSQRSFIIVPRDRIFKISNQDCKFSWHHGYNSAVLSKGLKFIIPLHEKFSQLVSSQVAVSCWNVQGVSPTAVDKASSAFDLPIVCVQDIFLTSDNDVETQNYTWFTTKKLWGKNVGILIKTCPDITMADFEVVSECLCVGNVELKGSKIKVICCGLPPHTDTARFQEETEKLMKLVKSIPEETVFVIAGDFNTHINYTMLEDILVYDEGDGNASFVHKLMKECNLELSYMSKNAVTQVSEKVRRNSSQVFMSQGCLLEYSQRRYVRWVPFFENGIVTLFLPRSDPEQDHVTLSLADSKEKHEGRELGNVEHVDGFIYVTRKFCRIKKYLSVHASEHQAYRFIAPESRPVKKIKIDEKSDLPNDIVEKYKNSPPPLEELISILGVGFTLYFGFLHESSLLKGSVTVLTASFEALNRGSLLAECIDVLEEETVAIVKKIIKFRWNGIVVHQYEGGKFASYKKLINKCQSELVSRLGQHCFTVKARSSFYNDGLPPLCEDKEKLDKVMRFVKRTYFPSIATVEDVKKFMNKFFEDNPYCELVFGSDFSRPKFLEPLRKYAASRSYMARTFKSSKDSQHFENLSIFINHSPQKISHLLAEIPEHRDLRFQLIPPCGTDKDYFEWCDQWVEKPIPEEYFKPYEKILKTAEPGTGKASSNGKQEDSIKTGSKKRIIGYVHRAIRNVGAQIQHRVTKCCNLTTINTTVLLPKGKRDWVKKARDETDLPEETVSKYCETPPPIEELCRILGGDFILYYGFRRVSSVVSTPVEVLAESFEATGRGGMMAEYIEVLEKRQPLKRIVKFKWNGICVHVEEGSVDAAFKNIALAGQTALIDKLGRHFHTIRAKLSFFNKGLPPLTQDKEKLKESLKEVQRSEFPPTVQVEDVKKFIIESLRDNPEVELVFGPEFSLSEVLEPIKKMAADKELGHRWFKSKEDLKEGDSIAVFVRRSPLEIREMLMKLPDHHNLRFFLVPPCEFANKSHYDWIKYWAAELHIEEFKLLMAQEDEMLNPPPVTVADKETKPKPVTQNNTRQQMSRSQLSTVVAQKRTKQQTDYTRESPRSQPSKIVRRNQRARPPRDQRGGNARPQPSRPAGRTQQVWQQQTDYHGGNSHSEYYGDNSHMECYGESSYSDNYRENSNLQPSRSDDYNTSNWSGNQDYRSETAGRKRDWQEMDYYKGSSQSQPSHQDYGSSYWLGGQEQYPNTVHVISTESYGPERKRARQLPTVPKSQRPRWFEIGPLLIVWPVNIRSENERNPRKVLEANFPTEISLEANNSVAVYVTLPVYNRRDKKFCLCIGDGVYNATKNALDMIVKRSSIIKYNESFLPPDGLVPNFIRYNVPCQTNPRTYITLGWMDTGDLTKEKVIELFDNFKNSLNEDLFFDKNGYTHDMKQMLLDLAPKSGLQVRHFGIDQKLVDRYICVYKLKPKEQVLEEVLKMSNYHPKYKLVTNKLPPSIGLNIF